MLIFFKITFLCLLGLVLIKSLVLSDVVLEVRETCVKNYEVYNSVKFLSKIYLKNSLRNFLSFNKTFLMPAAKEIILKSVFWNRQINLESHLKITCHLIGKFCWKNGGKASYWNPTETRHHLRHVIQWTNAKTK